jgi:hypothetical protein
MCAFQLESVCGAVLHLPTETALRVIANLVKPDFTPEAEANVAIGRRVRVVFQDLADHMALPQFALTEEPASGRVWRMPE